MPEHLAGWLNAEKWLQTHDSPFYSALEDLQHFFAKMFNRSFARDLCCGCEVYLVAPPEMLQSFVAEAASEKGYDVGSADGGIDMNICLSGAHFQRLIGYRKLIKEKFDPSSHNLFFIVNLEQTSGFHGSVSDIAPALLTKSTLCVLQGVLSETEGSSKSDLELPPSKMRLVLPLEHFAMLSFPLLFDQEVKWGGFFPWHVDWLQKNMAPADLKKLTGNGMHLHAVGAMLALVLALCSKKRRRLRLRGIGR